MAVLGYCKKCKKTHEIPVFFELNTENKISYCPRCGHQMTTKQANENYNKCLKDLYSEAEVLLFKAHDYEKAYRSYGKIIDAHPEDVVARYGRILSLIYLSTLRAPKFSDALVMFQSEKVKYLRLASYRKIYFAFLKQVNLALDNYHKKFMYRLMAADEYFYDVDCVSLYYDRILQIKNFKKVIKDECNYLSNKLLDESFEPLLNKIETEITLLDKELHGKKTTLEGVQYSFTKIGKDGRPIVSYGERRVLIKNQNKYPLYKLDKNAQNLPIIKDEIYKQKSWLYLSSKIVLPTFFATVSISIVFYILAAIFRKNLLLPFMIIATLFLSISMFAIILYGLWNILVRMKTDYFLTRPSKRK